MLVLLLAALVAGLATSADAATVFWNVTIVDPAGATVRPAVLVEVEDGRIVRVEAIGAQTPEPGDEVIEGSGKFLIPGLWDSHVHLTKLDRSSLPLFLAYGVTSVRDMGSDLDEVIGWRGEIDRGEAPGPRIKTSGQIVESRSNVERMLRERTVEPVARIRIPIATPEEGRAAVRRLARGGADFIKMRTTPDEATLEAVAAECRTQGLRLAGHPVALPEVLIRIGFASVEHALTLEPFESAADRSTLYRRMKQAGVSLGSTTANFDNAVLLSAEEAEKQVREDVRMKYVGDYLRRDWQEQIREKRTPEAEQARNQFRALLPALWRDLAEMRSAGVTFLPGSDAAVLLTFPGSSLHDELESLVREVGMTPAEALRSATSSPAEFFGIEAELGSIAPGALADLVLVDANPLESVTNARRVNGVMARGRWYDQAAIGELKRLAERLARSTPSASESAPDPP